MCTIASTTAAIRLQAELLRRLLLAITIATSISGITRRANRYSTQIAAVLACSRPLFDKHQRYNSKSEPHDKYLTRNRHDCMFFSMMRSQHMSPVSLELGLQEVAQCGNGVIHRRGE